MAAKLRCSGDEYVLVDAMIVSLTKNIKRAYPLSSPEELPKQPWLPYGKCQTLT